MKTLEEIISTYLQFKEPKAFHCLMESCVRAYWKECVDPWMIPYSEVLYTYRGIIYVKVTHAIVMQELKLREKELCNRINHHFEIVYKKQSIVHSIQWVKFQKGWRKST